MEGAADAGASDPSALPGTSAASPPQRVVRLLLNSFGQPGIRCSWHGGVGLVVTNISGDPIQPDLQVGDALTVVGSSSLAEASNEEQALKLLDDECASSLAANRRGIQALAISDIEVGSPSPPPPPSPPSPPPAMGRTRLYKVWPAGNRFCCGGYCMTGSPGHECSAAQCLRESCIPDNGGARQKRCESLASELEGWDFINRPWCTAMGPANCFSWACILVPSILYFVIALPYYWSEVHPALPMTALFFFLMTVGCLLSACLADPGIIPRREVILATGCAEKLCQELGYNVLGETVSERGELRDGTERVSIPPELRKQGYRWCSTCRIVRPPRASHCADCDNCVMRFDHHCPFINNCVGQRNYLFFFGFTSSVCALALVVIPSLLWFLLVGTGIGPGQGSTTESYTVNSDAIVRGFLITLAAAGGTAAICVLGLWAYHLFLICSGLTTREHIKGMRTKELLPGMGEESTTCSRRGPSLLSTRAMVPTIAGSILGRRGRLPDPGKVMLQT